MRKKFCVKGLMLSFMLLGLLMNLSSTFAQSGRWQQAIAYDMDVSLNTSNHRISGRQTIKYKNNSPDTLPFIFVHLYWNAFQPGSSMDVRSLEQGSKVIGRLPNGRERVDWDARVRDRISKLTPEESGYCKLEQVIMAGKPQKIELYETIAKVILDKPIMPGATVQLNTVFESQVPIQIRRSGRYNAEGVAYSMSQWYPKVSEYDYQGWHPTPYIAREFYGVWGDFSVKITLDKDFKVAGTGELQNASAIGFGYDKPGTPLKNIIGPNRTWHFKGSNIHDFVWAADKEYAHITRQTKGGPLLHFFYKQSDRNDSLWAKTADTCAMAYPVIARQFGAYPWPVYSFIQGGDGGMEYSMATLVRSHSLGTAIHEWMHSWYQQLLGTNEGLYAWMDEGFTSFADAFVMYAVRHFAECEEAIAVNKVPEWIATKGQQHPWVGEYAGAIALARSKFEEPMSTHADHFATNYAYSAAAYSKGGTFLAQLGYILGDSLLFETMMRYYSEWKFKHPNPNDFTRVAEKVSGAELDWYKEYMVNTTKTVDYAIDSIWSEGGFSWVRIKRQGDFPLPVEVEITRKDSTKERHYFPLNLMYWNKTNFADTILTTTYPALPWTHRLMILKTPTKLLDIRQVEIDAAGRTADIDRKNNMLLLNW